MAQLSQILKQATGVVAARGEGVLLYDEDDRRYLDFTAGIGVTSTGSLPPAGGRSRAATGRHADPCAVHDGAAPPTAYPGRAAGRRAAAGPGPDVLRELRQRGDRGGAAAQPAGHRPPEHHRVPRWLPWPDRGRGVVDHLRHEIPLWLQPADGRRACVAVPRPRPLRLADRAGDRIRARPTRLHIADIERAGRHGCFLRRAGTG